MANLTDKELIQRSDASQKARVKRETAEITGLLKDLAVHVKTLQKINAPPLRPPIFRTTSVITIGRPRTNEPDGDIQINNFFDNLKIDLYVKRDIARQLLKEKRKR